MEEERPTGRVSGPRRLMPILLMLLLPLSACDGSKTGTGERGYSEADYEEALSCYVAASVSEILSRKTPSQQKGSEVLLQEAMNRGGFVGKTSSQVRADLRALVKQHQSAAPAEQAAKLKSLLEESVACPSLLAGSVR